MHAKMCKKLHENTDRCERCTVDDGDIAGGTPVKQCRSEQATHGTVGEAVMFCLRNSVQFNQQKTSNIEIKFEFSCQVFMFDGMHRYLFRWNHSKWKEEKKKKKKKRKIRTGSQRCPRWDSCRRHRRCESTSTKSSAIGSNSVRSSAFWFRPRWLDHLQMQNEINMNSTMFVRSFFLRVWRNVRLNNPICHANFKPCGGVCVRTSREVRIAVDFNRFSWPLVKVRLTCTTAAPRYALVGCKHCMNAEMSEKTKPIYSVSCFHQSRSRQSNESMNFNFGTCHQRSWIDQTVAHSTSTFPTTWETGWSRLSTGPSPHNPWSVPDPRRWLASLRRRCDWRTSQSEESPHRIGTAVRAVCSPWHWWWWIMARWCWSWRWERWRWWAGFAVCDSPPVMKKVKVKVSKNKIKIHVIWVVHKIL